MSDALTDISRSQRIGECWETLAKAEINFLVSPTKKNLSEIYSLCDKLSSMHGGYWGEDTTKMARDVFDSYRKKFDGKEKFVIDFSVITDFLKRQYARDLTRLAYFSDLIVRFNGISSDDSKYRKEFLKVYRGIQKIGHCVDIINGEHLDAKGLECVVKENNLFSLSNV